MSAGNRRGRVRAARSELFVGAGTCEEVDKIRGRSARSRSVPGRTRTRVWPRRTGREPVERFALRRVCGDFKAPAPAHRTRPPPDKRPPGTLGGGTTRRDHGARGPHQPLPETDTGSPTIAGRLARSPIPADSCANSEMAARGARRSVYGPSDHYRAQLAATSSERIGDGGREWAPGGNAGRGQHSRLSQSGRRQGDSVWHL